MKLFFHLLYHQFAWSYDYVAAIVSAGSWNKWVYSASDYIKNGRTLELGHGPGHLQLHLMKLNKMNIFGLDSSKQMSKITARRLRKHNSPLKLVLGNAKTLPYSSGCFDQVVSTFPSEYIFSYDTLSEIKRVLNPEGCILILFQAQFTNNKLLSRLMDQLFRITGQFNEITDLNQERLLEPFRKSGP